MRRCLSPTDVIAGIMLLTGMLLIAGQTWATEPQTPTPVHQTLPTTASGPLSQSGPQPFTPACLEQTFHPQPALFSPSETTPVKSGPAKCRSDLES